MINRLATWFAYLCVGVGMAGLLWVAIAIGSGVP